MKVYKCDRCNKIFDKESPYNTGDLYVKVYNKDCADLCDECRKSLTDWFNCPEIVEQI